jgi:2-amino-4-hydroxy-6-hydroxymethyldihydropteridine diphosphokinase
MALVFLLLGTNMGNKKANLMNAKESIQKAGAKIKKESSIYETEPWGFTDPVNFLNQVLMVETALKPDQLLRSLLQIEKQFGRVKERTGYEPRIIDIDILLYEDEVIRQEDIVIPHPLMHLRRFTLVPFCEIASSLMHPLLKKEMNEILRNCKDKGKVWLNRRLIP